MKKHLSLALVIILAALALIGCGGNAEGDGSADVSGESVKLYISCATVLDNQDALADALVIGEAIPSDGVMLAEVDVPFVEGDTPYSILQKAAEQGLCTAAHESNAGYGVFVTGINSLFNGDCGDVSGWLYSVNDRFTNDGSDKYTLSAGDSVKWLFSCDMGPDVGNDWQ